MSSWSSASGAFNAQYDWDDDQKTLWDSIMTGVIILGAMSGALGCGSLLKHGKRRIILLMNLLLIISVGVCMIPNLYVVVVGRFFWGISFGVFSVACPKFNTEITPIEYRGPFGATLQLMCTIGIMIPSLMALAIPSPIKPEDEVNKKFLVTQYYRVIYAVPILVGVLHTLMLLTCFKTETPVFLKENGKEEELVETMKRYYQPSEIKPRIAALSATEKDASADEVSYYDTFFDPRIRTSAWTGIFLATFQQLTGINAIIFFSSSLFDTDNTGEGITKADGTAILNTANFLATIVGVISLQYFGRKTLMLVNQVGVCVCLFCMYFFASNGNNQMILVFSTLFICFFEFGPGPIVWFHISEICNDKATSVGTVVNWLWTLVMAIFTSFFLNDWFHETTWLIFFGFSVLGLLFILFFMKETRGLSEDEVKRLYTKEPQVKM